MVYYFFRFFFFFKQKTAYEMRISDWSSDVCSSDLQHNIRHAFKEEAFRMLAANTVNRILRLSGLNIQRWHDPLFDLQSLTGKDAIATMLDGGAYKGNKAIIMLELFPHAEVHCFEPQPEPFRNLQQRFCNEPRCSVMQAACAEVGGAAPGFGPNNMYASSDRKSGGEGK